MGLARIRDFGPDLLFVSLGLDTHRSDPHGSGGMTTEGFGRVAAAIGSLGFPAVLIQEGGYLFARPRAGPRRFSRGNAPLRGRLLPADLGP